jgi:hypothetical protein
MVAGLIFLIHIFAAIYAFAKYKKEGIGEGLLAVTFVVIIFSVGWTISTMVAKLVFPSTLVSSWITRLQETQISRMVAKELTIDTFSLVLLAIGEGLFYYFYLQTGEQKGEQLQKKS